MKKSRFTEEQIIAIPHEQEAGVATAEVCRKHAVSSATFYTWKAKFGGLDGRAPPEGAGRRECPAKADAGRRHALCFRGWSGNLVTACSVDRRLQEGVSRHAQPNRRTLTASG